MNPIQEQHYLDNMKRVAKRLIDLDSSTPGCVKLRTNPYLLDSVTEKLKRMGFKKRLLQSSEQFKIDCFLSYRPAAEALIHRVLLDTKSDDQGRHHCWHGSGRYIGWEGLSQLADWTREENCNFIFMVNIAPFFDRISDLLDHISSSGHDAITAPGHQQQAPPATRESTTRQWYYFDQQGCRRGPVSEAELEKLFARGEIRAGASVWSEGLLEWVRFSHRH